MIDLVHNTVYSKDNKSKYKQKQDKISADKELRIGTWNITSLNGKEIEIVKEMDKYKIEILGISETKKNGKGTQNLINGYKLYYSGAQDKQRKKEGVGFIVSEELNKLIIDFSTISSRIITITIKLEEVSSIIQIYGPVEGTEDEKMKEFYEELQETLDKLKEDNSHIIIMGDWNARVGNDIDRGQGSLGKYGEEIINRNGQKMLTFCQENDIKIGNTMWEQTKDDRYTFVAMERKARSIIDYICYTNEMSNKIKKIKTVKEAELDTQHRLVVGKWSINSRKEERSKTYTRINIKKLKDKNTRSEYQKETDNILRKFDEISKNGSMEERWGIFRNTVYSTAEKCCGRKTIKERHKATDWWDENLKNLTKEKKTAWKRYILYENRQTREDYIDKRDKVKKAVREAKQKSWEKFGSNLNDKYKVDNRAFWTRIKAMNKGRNREEYALKDKNNQIILEADGKLEVWREHYVEKFTKNGNKVSIVKNREEERIEEDSTDKITQEEVEKAITNIKIGKAGGEDDINPEMIKWLGNEGKEWLWRICNDAWSKEEIPEDWKKNIIVPIYKKGEHTNCENYRAICLSSTCYKVYTRIIEKRLREKIETKLEDEQAAFRYGRQTNDNIHIIRNVMERQYAQDKELYLTFIDLKAAFDTVNREIIWTILSTYNVPQKLARVIESIYKEVWAKVQLKGKRSGSIMLEKGIKQGDSLSPLLFIVIMDSLIKRTRDKTNTIQTTIGYRNMQPLRIGTLLYADDIVLIADTEKKMQSLINVWQEEINKMELIVNIQKTKYMIVNEKKIGNGRRGLEIEGQRIEQVSSFEYLGNILAEDGKIDLDISNKIRKTNRVYYALHKTILGKKEIDVDIKLKVYNAISIPTLTYGCENWVVQRKHESAINATEMRYLRKIVGVTKFDKIRNEDIRATLQQQPILKKIENKQLQWFGHIMRMEKDRLPKKITELGKVKNKKRGRPRKVWMEKIKEIGEDRGKPMEDLKKLLKNRKEWKKWIQEDDKK